MTFPWKKIIISFLHLSAMKGQMTSGMKNVNKTCQFLNIKVNDLHTNGEEGGREGRGGIILD